MADRVRTKVAVVGVAAVEGLMLLVAVVLGVLGHPDTSPHPERVTTQVVHCDLGSYGAAQVAFTITNGDRVEHAYEVQLSVLRDGTALGTSLSYGNRVAPGQTVTVRALVPLTAPAANAACAAHAYIHDTHIGHR